MPFEKIRDNLKNQFPKVELNLNLTPVIDNLKEFLGKAITISFTVLRQAIDFFTDAIKEARK